MRKDFPETCMVARSWLGLAETDHNTHSRNVALLRILAKSPHTRQEVVWLSRSERDGRPNGLHRQPMSRMSSCDLTPTPPATQGGLDGQIAHASVTGNSRRTILRKLIAPLALLAIVALGCSAADLATQVAQPAPEATRTLAPTFTPTPDTVEAIIIITPPSGGTPGVITIPEGADPLPFIVPPPTETPTATETPTTEPGATVAPTPISVVTPEPGATATQADLPTPTNTQGPTPTQSATPTPTSTPTVTLTPTPYIVLDSGLASLRTGPGVEFPLVAQLGPEIPITIIGRNTEGTWYQLCCVNGASVWVAANSVRTVNDTGAVPLVAGATPPTPTWTPTATWTPTVTPTFTPTPYPFEVAIGPQFFPTNNDFLTIWVKLFIGTPPLEEAAEGYLIKVLFEGFERPPTNGQQASRPDFDFSASPGAGNRVAYNLKYEYTPPDPKTLDPNATQTRIDLIGTGTWTVYVTDGTGKQLSPAVTFTTLPANPNREVYIGWVRVR